MSSIVAADGFLSLPDPHAATVELQPVGTSVHSVSLRALAPILQVPRCSRNC
jgi:hypothetical protein